MNTKTVLRYLGYILCIEGIFMIPALIIAIFKGETSSVIGFLATILIIAALGIPLALIKTKDKSFYAKEGYITVAFSWIVMSLLGALPFVISGSIPSYIDALFETVSGFTTTGSSILTNIETLPMSMLYWRAFIIWLGGMGVLVFVLAIIPMAAGNAGSFHIMRAESPGPEVGKLLPKLRATARALYLIYVGMTVLEMVLLLIGGMPFFDALTTSLSTAGTGGFSIRNQSIGAYDSYYLQTVVAIFMGLFAINFNIYFLLLTLDFKSVFKNLELRVYLAIFAISTVLISFNIFNSGIYDNLYDSFHHSFFQVSTLISSTGFSTTNYDLWPSFSKTLLFIIMLIGSCAGSTGGGMKIHRVIILYKSCKNELLKLVHPKNVRVVKINGKTTEDSVVHNVFVYFAFYMLILFGSTLLISLDGYDLETNISSVVTCLNNMGPGFSLVGPAANFSFLSDFSKIVLSLNMLLGRLEIFPLILILTPSLYKRAR